MSIFVSVKDMRVRLGLPDADDVNAVLQAALEDTTGDLEADFRTSFARNTVTDTFFVRDSLNYGTTILNPGVTVQNNRTGHTTVAKIPLARGFVDAAEATTVVIHGALRNIDEAGGQVNLKNVEGDDFTSLDYERGLLFVNDYTLHNQYLKVSYVAGFTTDGGTPEVFVVPAAHRWLQTAAKARATVILSDHPLIARESTGGDAGSEKRRQREQDRALTTYETLVTGHARYIPQNQGRLQTSVLTAAP